jgi:uncharacterized coiled-coil DUF342 family protein
MFSLLGKIFKSGIAVVAVLSVLGLGAFLVAGPQRAQAVTAQLQESVQEAIDQHVDETTKMRTQLREMEREYPERISSLRGELGKVQKQMRQVRKDRQINIGAAALAAADLDELGPKVAALIDQDAGDKMRLASVRFHDKTMSVEMAEKRLVGIRESRDRFSKAAMENESQLETLDFQRNIIEEQVLKLEGEYGELRQQIKILDDKIQTVARNEAIIEQLEATKKMVERYRAYEPVSVDSFNSAIDEMLLQQEAEMNLLLNGSPDEDLDYESMAREQLQSGEAPEVEAHQAEVDYELPSVIRSASNGSR